jgi:hypothetical protein
MALRLKLVIGYVLVRGIVLAMLFEVVTATRCKWNLLPARYLAISLLRSSGFCSAPRCEGHICPCEWVQGLPQRLLLR